MAFSQKVAMKTRRNVDGGNVARASEPSQMQPRHGGMTRQARLAIDKNKNENKDGT
jgi:hypothetical protein